MLKSSHIAIFILLILYQLPLKTTIAMEKQIPPQEVIERGLKNEPFEDPPIKMGTTPLPDIEWGLQYEKPDNTSMETRIAPLPDIKGEIHQEKFNDTSLGTDIALSPLKDFEWGLLHGKPDDTPKKMETAPLSENPTAKTGNTPEDSLENAGIDREIIEGFSGRLNILTFGVGRGPVTSSILASKLIEMDQYNYSKYQAEIDIRPDFALDFRQIHLSIKPRLKLKYEKWPKELNADEYETTDEFFVNEWLARVMITNKLFVSYGRENLQWGPSYLISPSNPFIKDNGRDNPKIEVAGLDYARVIWIPHYNWSASFIANTDEGRQDFSDEFEKTYALKIDFTGYEKYFSLIPSYKESEENIGFFTGWSVSDALLLYGEGNIHTESDVNNSTDLDLLLGTSYTFEMGPTLACEYFYNENGVTGPIHEAYIPSIPASQEVPPPPMTASLEASLPSGTASPDDVLIRKNYGLLQLFDSNVRDHFNYVLRWIYNGDDHSSRAIGIFEYEIGDHFKLFTIEDFFIGDMDDEFGSLNDYSVYLGFELTF